MSNSIKKTRRSTWLAEDSHPIKILAEGDTGNKAWIKMDLIGYILQYLKSLPAT
jgi:hypothetical protein